MTGQCFAFFRWRCLLQQEHGWLVEPLPYMNRAAIRYWRTGYHRAALRRFPVGSFPEDK